MLNYDKGDIVISGMSVNTPIGDTLNGFVDALYDGRSAITRWHSIDTKSCYSKVGADLGHYDTEGRIEELRAVLPDAVWRRLAKLHGSLPWSTKLTTLLAADAFIDAELMARVQDCSRIGVIVSGHNIGVNYDFNNRSQFDARRAMAEFG